MTNVVIFEPSILLRSTKNLNKSFKIEKISVMIAIVWDWLEIYPIGGSQSQY